MTVVLVVLCALGFSIGIIMAVSAWTAQPALPKIDSAETARPYVFVQAAAALAVGALGMLLTGWVVVFVAGGIAGWKLSEGYLNRSVGAAEVQERIEALATWCEQLRDLLAAEEGPESTVHATVPICPIAIRPEVSRLSTRLSRQDPRNALDEFAVEVGDSSGDLVASVLREAMSSSGKTADLLSELATTIRERATMRLRVEADRTGQRSEGRFVIGFASFVMATIAIFGRDTTFLSAYDSASGQTMLAIIAALFIAGVLWLNKLTRFDEPARFLSMGRQR